MDLGRHLERLAPPTSEAAYDRLTCYRFAQRHVGEGKSVANIGWKDVGYGSRLLAETAESVVGLTSSPEAVDLASAAYSAPNVIYQRIDLPALPYSEDYFDAVVAFEVVERLERPEDLVKEIKRVLKQDGLLLVSALDRQAHANDRRDIGGRREMYATEFRELLERHFEHVHVYRQGAVAGGLVFPASGEVAGAVVESARISFTHPFFGVEPPTTHSVIAACTDAGVLGQQEEQPYLLLDHDRRIFDECEDHAEDIELLRSEIQRMQKTEVQAFQEALKVHRSEIAYLKARLERLVGMESSRTWRLYWRLFGPYRQLRAKIDAVRKSIS